MPFKTGQKWISNAEPDLGMGRVIRVDERTVSLYFDAADEQRMYARAQAPLTRARFNPGDRIVTTGGITLTVKSVVDRNGIFVYHGEYQGTNTAVVETELDANVRFSKPEDRLFTRQIDDNRWFDLRYRALAHRARLATTPARGLLGPRVAPVPHQFYIAAEVASRFAPRVLLADEVGLGKTIEAGLILHQQLQTSRAARVLIIVPPTLTFQWFVEMIRRFNLQFTLLDEERCQQIVADNQSEEEDFNPFDAQQLMLCSLDLFLHNPARLEQAVETEWDLVVVDEAHHLHWTPEAASSEYLIVELISKISKGLLLLTATPEQLGRAGHFARLRLLDPDRFHDFEAFSEEEQRFEAVVDAVNTLLTGDDEAQRNAREQIRSAVSAGDEVSDDALIDALLDRHGTGRVLFRNVRSSVQGFPRRVPLPVALTGDEETRVAWLIDLLQDRPADKFLLICHERDTVISLEKSISSQTAVRTAMFHEGMDLIARDRAAAYFAETGKGAQILLCSEIGSEGRNFQFAHNLILFDLPPSPDLLEQRIGRLDRIGQRRDVQIHIPYLQGSDTEQLFRWYQEGLDAFERPNPVAQSLFEELGAEVVQHDLAPSALDELIDRTRELNRERLAAVSRGRDRLLEMNSHRPDVSARIIKDVRESEGGEELEDFMERSFDIVGLESEPLGDNVFAVKPTEQNVRHFAASIETTGRLRYPELPEDGIRITYDRDTALAREDVAFFTWENPMVEQALDLASSSTTGNTAMVAIRHPDIPSSTLLIEALHVIDCLAPAGLGVDRYLPSSVLRSVISPRLEDVGEQLPYSDFRDNVIEVSRDALLGLLESQRQGILEMLSAAAGVAGTRRDALVREAIVRAETAFDREIERLEALRQVNASIRSEEIDYLKATRQQVMVAIEQADVRLDAIRVLVAA